MLKPKVLPQILLQANSEGVKSAIILNKEGSLLASSGEDMNSSQVVAAIAANIWSAYDKVHHSLEVMLFDCQEGNVAVTEIGDSKLLLCLYGDNTAHFGLLKTKINTLREYLKQPLQQLQF